MIIQVEGVSAADVAEAERSLMDLARDWNVTVAETAPPQTRVLAQGGAHRGTDPIALTSLILSLPSTFLAVADLADRIKQRQRAKDLIDHARLLADKGIAALVITETRTIELGSLSPDQLIALAAAEAES
ncbi:MAG TPA: hypothetical protein VHV09_23675 [Trebonia sp.]|jgi:hypothetical protein|nr:hypothetical protein [Trebonia sp.]